MEVIELDDMDYMSHLYMNAYDMFGDCEYKVEKYVDEWLRQEWDEEKQAWVVQPKMDPESKKMWLAYKTYRESADDECIC